MTHCRRRPTPEEKYIDPIELMAVTQGDQILDPVILALDKPKIIKCTHFMRGICEYCECGKCGVNPNNEVE
jgi:hypothetical protein